MQEIYLLTSRTSLCLQVLAVPAGTEPPLEGIQPPSASIWSVNTAHQAEHWQIYENLSEQNVARFSETE